MVGFGAGAYVLAMLDRAGLAVHVDCGAATGTVPTMPSSPTPATSSGCALAPGNTRSPAGVIVLALAGWLATSRRQGHI